MGPGFWPLYGKKWLTERNCYFESKYMYQKHCWGISFFIFGKYGLNYTRKSRFWHSYVRCCLEIMARNHKKLNIKLWDYISPMAITWTYFFWFLWKSFGGANTQWSKNHVQARTWDRVITQNSIFIQKLLCNAAHNGGGLRSGAKCKYSIVCSNMVLSGKRN